MKKRILFFLILTLSLLLTFGCTEQKDIFYGKWVISAEIETSGVTALSDEEVKTLLGTKVTYDKTFAKLGDTTITNPIYEKVVFNEREFIDYTNLPLSELGIHESTVTTFDMYLNEKKESVYLPGDWIIIKDKETLITFWGGVYFMLTREE